MLADIARGSASASHLAALIAERRAQASSVFVFAEARLHDPTHGELIGFIFAHTDTPGACAFAEEADRVRDSLRSAHHADAVAYRVRRSLPGWSEALTSKDLIVDVIT